MTADTERHIVNKWRWYLWTGEKPSFFARSSLSSMNPLLLNSRKQMRIYFLFD